MTKAYSYVRFSTPEQMKGDSLRRQTHEAAAYAERHGLELDEELTFEDRGISGFHGKNARKGALRRFLDAVEQELIPEGSFLLVENLDRMSRQEPWEALPTFQQIINGGITIVTLQDGRTWNKAELRQNPFRIMESLMVMIRANEESATKARRLREVRSAARAAIRSGQRTRVFTSRCPAWLTPNADRTGFDVIAERAEIVRRVFAMTAEGIGQHKVAAVLNGERVPTWGDAGRPAATHWRRSYLIKMLDNPAVEGTFTPHVQSTVEGRKVRTAEAPIRGYFPAVVEPELYQRVQALRVGAPTPSRGRHAAAEVKNVLGGLAKCPKCGATMTRVSKGSSAKAGKPYLVCEAAKVGRTAEGGVKVCRYRAVPMDDVEAALRESMWLAIEEAPGPEAQEAEGLDARIEGHEVALADLRERAGTLVVAIERGGPRALTDRLTELESVIASEERAMRELQERRAATFGPFLAHRLKALREAFEGEPFDRSKANALLRGACSAVTVDYDAGMLTLSWLHGGASGIAYSVGDLSVLKGALPRP